MRTSRTIWPLVLAAVFVTFAVSGEETQRTNSASRITVIKYCLQPFGTFEIAGTDVKGVSKPENLTKVLRNHKKQNLEAKYEVLAEVKSTPEGEKAIVEAIAKAGIALEHYWAAHSAWAPGTPVGPHGVGYVDHIDRYKKSRPDGAANWSRPVGRETNRTSWAASSGG